MPRHVHGSTLYWSIPLTLLAATTYYTLNNRKVSAQPLKFVPSGEPSHDSENMERIRADWRERNRGIGLRDVRYLFIFI
ncbi:hypothetical protein BDA99DRAFT_525537, partial [Phascolomyces articulosus]